MQRNLGIVISVIFAALLLTACGQTTTDTSDKVIPAIVETIEGSDLNRVILTERAAERLGIETAPIGENGSQGKTVPYGAVIYDLTGVTWVYVNSAPLTYVREMITIESIDGDLAILSAGPDVGTEVATVGVAELYGTDTGVGK